MQPRTDGNDYGKRLTALTAEVMAIMIWELLGVGIFGTLQGAGPNEAQRQAEAKRKRRIEKRKRLINPE